MRWSFLADPSIETHYFPGVLEIFGSLVTYDKGKSSGWMKKVCNTMPMILLQFDAQSCLGCGYCLLTCCTRHTFDSKMPSIDMDPTTLILHEGEVGIHLRSKVPVSMKSNIYWSEIVATPTKILCCQCTCYCGSHESERVVCVHNLPLLLNLSVFIGECLGEHMLLEMAACWSSSTWDKGVWSNSKLCSMKKNVSALMVAANPSINSRSMAHVSIDH
jgi:hypothetical protein